LWILPSLPAPFPFCEGFFWVQIWAGYLLKVPNSFSSKTGICSTLMGFNIYFSMNKIKPRRGKNPNPTHQQNIASWGEFPPFINLIFFWKIDVGSYPCAVWKALRSPPGREESRRTGAAVVPPLFGGMQIPIPLISSFFLKKI